MSTNTSIEWTDRTWNPVRGCSMAKGSELGGCLNCYAARMAARNLPELKSPTTGRSFARILVSGPRWTGEVELIESALAQPLHWRAPKKVFVNSMSDLFHEALPDEAIDRVFAVMALCPQHQFQILTKRPERMLKYQQRTNPGTLSRDVVLFSDTHPIYTKTRVMVADYRGALSKWPLPNVWLGVSVEDQKTADERIPLLLQTPAAVRFVSYEPALGPILNWEEWLGCGHRDMDDVVCWKCGAARVRSTWLDWVIVGGESGPGARPFDIAWARSVIQQCKAADVACFVKQLGGNARTNAIKGYDDAMQRIELKNKKGGDWSEWPQDLRVREFPEAINQNT